MKFIRIILILAFWIGSHNAFAQPGTCVFAYIAGEFDEALKLCAKEAEQGNTQAMLNLA